MTTATIKKLTDWFWLLEVDGKDVGGSTEKEALVKYAESIGAVVDEKDS